MSCPMEREREFLSSDVMTEFSTACIYLHEITSPRSSSQMSFSPCCKGRSVGSCGLQCFVHPEVGSSFHGTNVEVLLFLGQLGQCPQGTSHDSLFVYGHWSEGHII
ncbi:uncharacterized protein LOC143661352 isoform X2 [Tamandua tetradactyla]|uniref:uncharacterized protein LOC143661352 isoform X2 n=1 Tax=Tamandua tetradactyla TaxID=48850 RepID=UPI0040546D4A